MPADGVKLQPHEEILSYDEIFRIAGILSEMGVNKIRLTGGEPLVRKNLEILVEKLSSLKKIKTICLTTNGYFLKEKVHLLKRSGLTHVNISIDTLDANRFKNITLREGYYQAMQGIHSAIVEGFTQLKLNVVVIRNVNDDEILDFVDFVKDKPVQVRFIEFMPFKNNNWEVGGFISFDEMEKIISTKYELIPSINENVSKDFSIEGFTGSVGFITSMSNHFCNSCNRLRLTADGFLKTCLFSNDELNIKVMLRDNATDEEIKLSLLSALSNKNEMHDGVSGLLKLKNRPMVQIGG
jgi:cyclic pyranopterin phosphate synthase